MSHDVRAHTFILFSLRHHHARLSAHILPTGAPQMHFRASYPVEKPQHDLYGCCEQALTRLQRNLEAEAI